MYGIAAHTLADRFAWLIEGLCKAIGSDAHRRRMEAALAWAVWNRVRLLGERLVALAERARRGRLAARPPSRVLQKEKEKRAAARSADALESRLPREFGWLPETAQFAGVLAYLLRDPEMIALVEQAPRAGRLLRPLCRLLGVKAPEFLRGVTIAGPSGSGRETSPPIREEQTEAGGVSAAADPPPQPAVATGEVAEAGGVSPADPPATQPSPLQTSPPPPVPYHLRRGGLYWDGRRWQWS
jgi:hypothetical protein